MFIHVHVSIKIVVSMVRNLNMHKMSSKNERFLLILYMTACMHSNVTIINETVIEFDELILLYVQFVVLSNQCFLTFQCAMI